MTTTLPSDPLALSDIEVLRMLEQELLIPETLRDSINSDIVLLCVQERIREIEARQQPVRRAGYSESMKANFIGPLRDQYEANKVVLGYDPGEHWRAKREEREAMLLDLAIRQHAKRNAVEQLHRRYLRGGPAPGEEEDPPTGGLSSPAEDVVTTPTHREEIR